MSLNKTTIFRIYSRLKKIVHEKMSVSNIKLGESGVIVEIDKSLFSISSKYHRGRSTNNIK